MLCWFGRVTALKVSICPRVSILKVLQIITFFAVLFASTLFRMENNEDMKSIWEQANANMDFPEIIEETPAGVWKKAESTSCSNSGDNRYRDNTILFYLLLILNLSKISINFLFYWICFERNLVGFLIKK